MSTTCRSCGAEIFWCVTPANKRIPLDAKPCTDGNLVTRTQAGDDGREVLDGPMLALSVAAVEKLAENGIAAPPGEPKFKSHFATCKDASRWRTK